MDLSNRTVHRHGGGRYEPDGPKYDYWFNRSYDGDHECLVSVHICSDVYNVVGDDGRYDGAFRCTDDLAVRLGHTQAG